MSIEWLKPDDANDGLPHLDLIRATEHGLPPGIITCSELWGCMTHYYQGRTQPCLGNVCEPCANQKPKRYEGYLSIWVTSAEKHYLIGLTPAAAQQLTDITRGLPTLRGVYLELKRKRRTKHSRLEARAYKMEQLPVNLPAAPPVPQLLYKIWRYDPNTPDHEEPAHIKAARTMLRDYNAQRAKQTLANANKN